MDYYPESQRHYGHEPAEDSPEDSPASPDCSDDVDGSSDSDGDNDISAELRPEEAALRAAAEAGFRHQLLPGGMGPPRSVKSPPGPKKPPRKPLPQNSSDGRPKTAIGKHGLKLKLQLRERLRLKLRMHQLQLRLAQLALDDLVDGSNPFVQRVIQGRLRVDSPRAARLFDGLCRPTAETEPPWPPPRSKNGFMWRPPPRPRDHRLPPIILAGDPIFHDIETLRMRDTVCAMDGYSPSKATEAELAAELCRPLPFTVYTFQHMLATLVRMCHRLPPACLARTGGPLSAEALCALVPYQLLDWRAANPADGRLSPLALPMSGPFMTPHLHFSMPWSHIARFHYLDSDGRLENGPAWREHMYQLALYRELQALLLAEERSESHVRAPCEPPFHDAQYLRWNMAIPIGLPICGDNPGSKALHVEIHIKRISGADLPLALACGVHHAVFNAIMARDERRDFARGVPQPVSDPDVADATEQLLGSGACEGALGNIHACAKAVCSSPCWAEHPATFARRQASTVYVVRIVGHMPWRHRKGPGVLMASGGWVAPPLAERRAFTAGRTGITTGSIAAQASATQPSTPSTDLPTPLAMPAHGRPLVDSQAAMQPVLCHGAAPEVWHELADPAQEDVLWLAWKLVTGTTYRGFQRGAGVGVDRFNPRNKAQLASWWVQKNPFVSPSPLAQAHAELLLRKHHESA